VPPRRPPYVAYLRVFEPVEHLPEPARTRWTEYAAGRPDRLAVEADEFTAAVRRLVRATPALVPPDEVQDGLLVESSGQLYVCPQQTRLRVWRQLASADLAVPPLSLLVGEAALPALREQAAADLAAYTGAGGELRLFTRSVTWQVPVSWFLPFSAEERELQLEPGSPRSLRYRTTMSAARRRCALGLRAARAHLDDVDVVAEIEQVSRWLEQFDHRSLLELDYAGLVELLDDVHLRGDDSASDVAQGLAALTEGDALSAAAAYRRWSIRWQRVGALARAS
jgi:hypothetical protein